MKKAILLMTALFSNLALANHAISVSENKIKTLTGKALIDVYVTNNSSKPRQYVIRIDGRVSGTTTFISPKKTEKLKVLVSATEEGRMVSDRVVKKLVCAKDANKRGVSFELCYPIQIYKVSKG